MNTQLKIGKHGFVKVRGLRNITGKILSITVSKIGVKWPVKNVVYADLLIKDYPYLIVHGFVLPVILFVS